MPETAQDAGEVFRRLATVEREMATIVTTIGGVSEAISRIERHQEALAHRQANQGKANWPVVITAAGAVLTLLVFYTGMVSGPIAERQTLTSQFLQKQITDLHGRMDRHSEADLERSRELAAEIKKATADRFTRSDFDRYLDRQAARGD